MNKAEGAIDRSGNRGTYTGDTGYAGSDGAVAVENGPMGEDRTAAFRADSASYLAVFRKPFVAVTDISGVFGANDPVTREQMVTLFWRYRGRPVIADVDLSAYIDADQISDWAKDAFAWAVSIGVIRGKGNGILDPRVAGTRAEAAQIIMNCDEKAG